MNYYIKLLTYLTICTFARLYLSLSVYIYLYSSMFILLKFSREYFDITNHFLKLYPSKFEICLAIRVTDRF